FSVRGHSLTFRCQSNVADAFKVTVLDKTQRDEPIPNICGDPMSTGGRPVSLAIQLFQDTNVGGVEHSGIFSGAQAIRAQARLSDINRQAQSAALSVWRLQPF